jgi:hypothetical protein
MATLFAARRFLIYNQEFMQEAHQLQANAYIPKPLSLTNLHEVIGSCGPARMKTGTP